jgi:hypothetical protein
MSEDDRWSDVIHQVLNALDEANVEDPSTRVALADGVREALESLGSNMDINIEVMGTDCLDPSVEPMGVEVVDGGREADTPPTEGKKPSLRIAEPAINDMLDEEDDTPPIRTQVKVMRSTPRTGYMHNPGVTGFGETGWIEVSNNGEAETLWQTVYQGLRPRLYRIACLPGGRLDVTVDGTQVERLCPGQSIDIEGMAIRVTTPDDEGSGVYGPVSYGGGEE